MSFRVTAAIVTDGIKSAAVKAADAKAEVTAAIQAVDADAKASLVDGQTAEDIADTIADGKARVICRYLFAVVLPIFILEYTRQVLQKTGCPHTDEGAWKWRMWKVSVLDSDGDLCKDPFQIFTKMLEVELPDFLSGEELKVTMEKCKKLFPEKKV